MKNIFIAILLISILGGAKIASAMDLNLLAHNFKTQYALDVSITDNTTSFNTVEGALSWPSDKITINNISDGDSIVNFWIEKPTIKNHRITFAGMIPGGYTASSGKLFTIFFTLTNTASAEIDWNIQRFRYYLNDGEGTAIDISSAIRKVSLPTETIAKSPLSNDVYPPEKFQPILTRDSELFENKNFLVFETQDKGSGLKKFLVAESRRAKKNDLSELIAPEGLRWEEATSPYLLKDQTLSSFIFVRAIDNVGNETVGLIYPQKPEAPLTKIYLSVIIILITAALVFCLFYYVKKNK